MQAPEQLSVEDLVAIVQRLPPGMPAVPAVALGLHGLDSRACAALLKELSSNGLPHHALAIFDWLQSLPMENQLSRLCDVFTYTTGDTHNSIYSTAHAQQHVHHCTCTTGATQQHIRKRRYTATHTHTHTTAHTQQVTFITAPKHCNRCDPALYSCFCQLQLSGKQTSCLFCLCCCRGGAIPCDTDKLPCTLL